MKGEIAVRVAFRPECYLGWFTQRYAHHWFEKHLAP